MATLDAHGLFNYRPRLVLLMARGDDHTGSSSSLESMTISSSPLFMDDEGSGPFSLLVTAIDVGDVEMIPSARPRGLCCCHFGCLLRPAASTRLANSYFCWICDYNIACHEIEERNTKYLIGLYIIYNNLLLSRPFFFPFLQILP